MKIAVATRNGQKVDLHFGHAETFFIYDVEDGAVEFSESFEVTPYSSGDTAHDFNEARFHSVYVLLKDCEKLFCTKIGEKPREELFQRGIETIECDCDIADLPL